MVNELLGNLTIDHIETLMMMTTGFRSNLFDLYFHFSFDSILENVTMMNADDNHHHYYNGENLEMI